VTLHVAGKFPRNQITTDSDQVVDIQRLEDEVSAEKQPTQQVDVSENRGTPKSSILIGFSIINHTFWGTPISGWKHPNQQTSLPPKDWHFFWFMEAHHFQLFVLPKMCPKEVQIKPLPLEIRNPP